MFNSECILQTVWFVKELVNELFLVAWLHSLSEMDEW